MNIEPNVSKKLKQPNYSQMKKRTKKSTNEKNVQPKKENTSLKNANGLTIAFDELVDNVSFTETNNINSYSAHLQNHGKKINLFNQSASKSKEPSSNDVLKCISKAGRIANEKKEDKSTSDDDDDDGDDDSFYNQLFSNVTPVFVTAATDTFPCSDDSDCEEEVADAEVKFFFNKSRSIAVAEYEDTEYRIGFLDLTTEEHSHLELISQTAICLSVKINNIKIDDNGKFNIKRINERHTSSQPNQPMESIFEEFNLGRIQFSTTEPFLAKYENDIYFVGDKLYHEYSTLLDRTKKCAGTAIRIGNNRLVIDIATQTLEVIQTIAFKHQSEIAIIRGRFDVYKLQNDYPLNGCRRYVVGHNPCTLLEVEPELIHASIYDDCTEIYAEIDFPFTDSERVETIVKETNKPIRSIKEEVINPEDEPLEMVLLKAHPVPKEIKAFSEKKDRSKEAIANTKFAGLLKKKTLRNNVKDYVEGSKMMIYLEEEAQANYLKKFDQTDIQLTYHMERQFYFPVTEELTELASAIEENVLDFLILHPKSNKLAREKKIYGQVYRIRERKIYIDIFHDSFKLIQKSYRNEWYDITFTLNRMPYQLQHNALHFVEREKLFKKLIKHSYYNCKSSKLIMPSGLPRKRNHVFKKEGTMFADLNTEQQVAVENMIGKVDNLPYVLFGPPGTGKTRTLVAAVEQIVRTTKQNVLICAMSNAACDEITERLIDVLKEDEMYRFYAKSYKHERVSARIKRVSNYSSEGIFYPSLRFLYKFRVFICTLCSAGCLTRARIDTEVWKPNHFGYVIIDECASAHETMCLIPIAGLCTSRREIHAKIILAGDPKQLDAVTRSDAARKMGYNTSWMERLCDSNLYKRKNGKFNELYITQLVKNYRSHPEILRIPNELFYENSLESFAKESDINWYINSEFLPSKQFPLVFKSVQGKCERSLEHSWYNEKEIDEVVSTIKELLPSHLKRNSLRKIEQSDIGVVTPYRKQRHKISQKLRRINLGEVTVGTAEVFQGKEKPVMIVSTVRSNGKLGFVAEPRRLNVVITRAKCLAVIVGDPHTLKLDANWLRVIEHCMRNNSFIQSNKEFKLNKAFQRPI